MEKPNSAIPDTVWLETGPHDLRETRTAQQPEPDQGVDLADERGYRAGRSPKAAAVPPGGRHMLPQERQPPRMGADDGAGAAE
jgi:hypothetical protein